VPIAFTSYAGMDIGRDNGLVVDRDYEHQAPYAFTGTVKQVEFDLQPLTLAQQQALHAHQLSHTVGQGASG
jgi:arylsulfatase